MQTLLKNPYDTAIALINDEFSIFEQRFTTVVERQQDYLSTGEIKAYRFGKKLRPLLLLLSAHAGARQPQVPLPEKAIAAAVSIELTHLGSLIHDDIVDKAPLRRGLPTISASRGYELALIIGDLQWIAATREMAGFVETQEDIVLMRQFLETGEQVCRGQLDEMLGESTDDIQGLIRRYYRTVDRKTGKLIAFACEGGARLAQGSPTAVGCLSRYGLLLGRAFQVMDDVLDIMQSSRSSGKARLTDLVQGRLSLPILYTLSELPEAHFLHCLVRGESLDAQQLGSAERLLVHGNGWLRALADARAIVAKALTNLQLLPESPYRSALAEIAEHIVNQHFLET